MRISLLIAFLLLSAPASAFQVCPYVSSGWTQTWSGPIRIAVYDRWAQVLYAVDASQNVTAFSNVPVTAMQSFTRALSPYQFYNAAIASVYHSIVLTEGDNCPLMLDAGRICELATQSGPLLAAQNGPVLLSEGSSCDMGPSYVWSK